MTTTVSANVPMLWIIPWRVQVAPCRSRAEKRLRVATISLLLKFSSDPPAVAEGSARVFAESTARAGAHAPRLARQTVLLVQRKDHVDRRVHFDRLAVEKSRLIAPLANGVKRRLLQERVSGHHFQLLNRPILADDGMQADGARNASLARERRINGLNAIDDACGLHVAADADRTRWFWLRRRRGANASNHAAQHAAHRTTGNAARNAAHGANDAGIGLGFFLNNLDILRD